MVKGNKNRKTVAILRAKPHLAQILIHLITLFIIKHKNFVEKRKVARAVAYFASPRSSGTQLSFAYVYKYMYVELFVAF